TGKFRGKIPRLGDKMEFLGLQRLLFPIFLPGDQLFELHVGKVEKAFKIKPCEGEGRFVPPHGDTGNLKLTAYTPFRDPPVQEKLNLSYFVHTERCIGHSVLIGLVKNPKIKWTDG